MLSVLVTQILIRKSSLHRPNTYLKVVAKIKHEISHVDICVFHHSLCISGKMSGKHRSAALSSDARHADSSIEHEKRSTVSRKDVPVCPVTIHISCEQRRTWFYHDFIKSCVIL